MKGIHLTTGLWEPPGLGGDQPGIWRTLAKKWKHTCGPFEKVHPVLPAAREFLMMQWRVQRGGHSDERCDSWKRVGGATRTF